ncbi:MAG: sodium-dependent transporter, partial [Oscillospiraceae bacterium]|nr:sodium-dependent transporter [Oscillospiraceae bacterium]
VKRIPACFIVIAFSLAMGMLSVLGFGVWSGVQPFGKSDILTFFDFLSNNIMMPIVALITCILIGYFTGTRYVEDEVQLNSRFKSKKLYRVMVRFICPIFMVTIFISSILGFAG